MTYDNSTYFLLFTPLVPSFVVRYRTTTASYYEETPYVVLVTTQNPKTIKWWIWFRLRRRLLSRSSQTHKEEEKQREEILLLVWAFLVGKRRNSIDFSAPSVVANESNNLSQRSACKHIVMGWAISSVFFWGFFRRFRRLTRRNSELDEDFGWVRQKIIWVRLKILWS